MSRDIQVPRPDPFPADKLKPPAPEPIFIPMPYPVPARPWVPVQQPQWPPCMFDNLPPGVYGIACPCPRCAPWCTSP